MARTVSVAKALILDSKDNFLLLTRGDTHPRLAGYYDLPGGQIEPDEEPGEAVIREIVEETGLSFHRKDLRLLYSVTKLLNEKSFPTLMYLVRIDSEKPDVELSWEHSKYEWAPLDRLPEVEPQLAATYREALDYIRMNSIIEDLN
jgi:8-oxo-dGTP diphosphatase